MSGRYMTLMMCFHRFACLRRYYHRLSRIIGWRAEFVLITTYLAVGVVQQMFWTHTDNEGQSERSAETEREKERTFDSSTSVCQEIERFASLSFCLRHKQSNSFFKGTISSTLTDCCFCVHFTLACLCLVFIYKPISSFSRTTQHSTNEWKWTSMILDRLPACLPLMQSSFAYVLSVRYFLSLCVYIYIYTHTSRWQGEETICCTLSLHLCQSVTPMRVFHRHAECLIKSFVCVCLWIDVRVA